MPFLQLRELSGKTSFSFEPCPSLPAEVDLKKDKSRSETKNKYERAPRPSTKIQKVIRKLPRDGGIKGTWRRGTASRGAGSEELDVGWLEVAGPGRLRNGSTSSPPSSSGVCWVSISLPEVLEEAVGLGLRSVTT